MSFTRVSSITFNSGEDIPTCAAIDTTNNFAYFGTATVPGMIIKVDLSTFDCSCNGIKSIYKSQCS